jgi:signal peptide peptidase SppA
MKTNIIPLFPSLWAILEAELTKIETTYQGFASDMIMKLETDSKLVLDSVELSQTGLSDDVTIIDNVGVLKIEGVITQKSNFLTMIFGGATLDALTADFKSLVNNEQIDTIVIDIDSPGGTVFGVQEFANLIFDAREQKKIISISSSIMTSAAMWIGAAAERVLISGNTVTTGSIGVLTTHIDTSLLEATAGITVTEITAGREKRIASTHAPLTDIGRSVLQGQVDKIMDAFVGDIAKFRGVSDQEARSNMADGKVFIGDNAVKANLVDDIMNFDLLIETINNGGNDMGLFSKKEANLDNLKTDHNDLYNEAVAIGAGQSVDVHAKNVVSAKADGHKEGLSAGAEAERARIQGIDKVTIKGQEELAITLKADGKTTPGEAAIQMINANKQSNTDGLKKIETTSAEAVEDEVEETITAKKDAKDMTAKEKWDADPKLAKEFASFEAFEAIGKNSGNFRILKQ